MFVFSKKETLMKDKKGELLIDAEIVEVKEETSAETTAVAVIETKKEKRQRKGKIVKSNDAGGKRHEEIPKTDKYYPFAVLSKLLHKDEQDVINECATMQLKKLLSSAGKTIVRYPISENDLKEVFLLAERFNFGEITVSPDLVAKCVKPVKKYELEHIKVSTIIGFPFGDDTFSGKIVSLKKCVALGVDEASVAMKFAGSDKAEVKLFKKQLKKINSCFPRRAGVALSVSDMKEESLVQAIKLIEKTDLNHALLIFGECTMQEVKLALDKINKVKGKKAIKVMLNAKSEEDIINFIELGASVVLTPFLDEIATSLAKKLGVF